MSLRQKQWLSAGVIAVGIVLMLLTGGDELLGAAGVLLVILGLVLNVVLVKCPSCGTWLGKYPGEYCKNCGED